MSGKHRREAGEARGRNAELQSKGKHSDNAFGLDPGHCHNLINPNGLIANNKWATRCVGCHPLAAATLALYKQKTQLKAMPKELVLNRIRLVSFCMHQCTFLVCGADFCMYVRTHTCMHAHMHA